MFTETTAEAILRAGRQQLCHQSEELVANHAVRYINLLVSYLRWMAATKTVACAAPQKLYLGLAGILPDSGSPARRFMLLRILAKILRIHVLDPDFSHHSRGTPVEWLACCSRILLSGEVVDQ